jgi:hypothetical protein
MRTYLSLAVRRPFNNQNICRLSLLLLGSNINWSVVPNRTSLVPGDVLEAVKKLAIQEEAMLTSNLFKLNELSHLLLTNWWKSHLQNQDGNRKSDGQVEDPYVGENSCVEERKNIKTAILDEFDSKREELQYFYFLVDMIDLLKKVDSAWSEFHDEVQDSSLLVAAAVSSYGIKILLLLLLLL